jgi:hypothetical protein
MSSIVDIAALSEKLNLTEEQKLLLSAAMEEIRNKYAKVENEDKSSMAIRMYCNGVADGLNHAYKIVNGIDDDYNLKT